MVYVQFPQYLSKEQIIWNPDSMFINVYENEWFEDPLVQTIIKDIDNCTLILDDVFIHRYYGATTADKLSGGCKTLILLLKEDLNERYILMSHLGDNCFKYLKDISKVRDVRLVGNCCIESKDGEVEYYLENVNQVVDNVVDYIINREY